MHPAAGATQNEALAHTCPFDCPRVQALLRSAPEVAGTAAPGVLLLVAPKDDSHAVEQLCAHYLRFAADGGGSLARHPRYLHAAAWVPAPGIALRQRCEAPVLMRRPILPRAVPVGPLMVALACTWEPGLRQWECLDGDSWTTRVGGPCGRDILLSVERAQEGGTHVPVAIVVVNE